MNKEQEIKENFNKILENNKDSDWNNPIQRQTIVDSLRFCANNYLWKKDEEFNNKLEQLKKEIEILGNEKKKEWGITMYSYFKEVLDKIKKKIEEIKCQ